MSLRLAKAIEERLELSGAFTFGSIVYNNSVPYTKEEKINYINDLIKKEEIYEVYKGYDKTDQYRTFHRVT